MYVTFFEISNLNNELNIFDMDFGDLFLKYRNVNPKTTMFTIIAGTDHIPNSNLSGPAYAKLGIRLSPDNEISAGKITDTKFIRII